MTAAKMMSVQIISTRGPYCGLKDDLVKKKNVIFLLTITISTGHHRPVVVS